MSSVPAVDDATRPFPDPHPQPAHPPAARGRPAVRPERAADRHRSEQWPAPHVPGGDPGARRPPVRAVAVRRRQLGPQPPSGRRRRPCHEGRAGGARRRRPKIMPGGRRSAPPRRPCALHAWCASARCSSGGSSTFDRTRPSTTTSPRRAATRCSSCARLWRHRAHELEVVAIGVGQVAIQDSGASPGASARSSCTARATTIAPAAFIRSKSALTSSLSMFQSSRPGSVFLPWTSVCGPTETLPLPICQPT